MPLQDRQHQRIERLGVERRIEERHDLIHVEAGDLLVEAGPTVADGPAVELDDEDIALRQEPAGRVVVGRHLADRRRVAVAHRGPQRVGEPVHLGVVVRPTQGRRMTPAGSATPPAAPTAVDDSSRSEAMPVSTSSRFVALVRATHRGWGVVSRLPGSRPSSAMTAPVDPSRASSDRQLGDWMRLPECCVPAGSRPSEDGIALRTCASVKPGRRCARDINEALRSARQEPGHRDEPASWKSASSM